MTTSDESPTNRLGPFEVLHELAAGGMSLLFLGRHTETGHGVVLKQLLPELARNRDHVAMFRAEAKLGPKLEHPNIVRTLATFNEPAPTLVLEYVDGPHLGRVMRTARALEQLPVAAALYVITCAADALHHAHAQVDARTGEPLGIVHRDVSPPNILVSHDGDVKLIDFGIATARDRDYKTETGILKGKVSYMAPEQVLARPLDGRTDIFALGIVAWELLAGRRLFKDGSDLIIMQRVVHEEASAVSMVRGEVPSEVDAVIARSLAKKPENRFQTAGEFAAALRALTCAPSPEDGRASLCGWLSRHEQRIDTGLSRNTPSSAASAKPRRDDDESASGTISLKGPVDSVADSNAPTSEGVVQSQYFRFDTRSFPLVRFSILGTPDTVEALEPVFRQFDALLAGSERYVIVYDARQYSGLKFPSLPVRDACRAFVERTKASSREHVMGFGVLVTSKLFGSFINAVLSAVRGDYPQRVFTDEAEAIHWARDLIELEPGHGLRGR